MSFLHKTTTLFANSAPAMRWLLGVGCVIACCLFIWLLYRLLKAGVHRLNSNLPSSKIITKPLQLVALAALLVITAFIKRVAPLPALVSLSLNTMATFLVALNLYQSVHGIATHFCRGLTGHRGRGHAQLVPLVASLLKVGIILVGILLTLRNLNFDVTPLLTSVSIGGIGFALASQDLFKNLFGSLVIFIDQPFQVGDTIVAKDIGGKVEEIGLRSTRLMTAHNSVTYVPNAQLANAYVDNYGPKKYHLFESHIELAYDTPTDSITQLIEGLKKIVAIRSYIRKDKQVVYVDTVQKTRLRLIFHVYLEANTRAQSPQYQQEVRHDISQLATHLGLDIGLSSKLAFIHSGL